MADLVMPKLGLTMTEGLLAEWRVGPGDAFAAGEGTAYLVRLDQHVAARWRQPAAADVRGAVLSALALAGAPPAA